MFSVCCALVLHDVGPPGCPSSDEAGALVWRQECIRVHKENDTPTWTNLHETGLRLPTYLHT